MNAFVDLFLPVNPIPYNLIVRMPFFINFFQRGFIDY